uniref:Uncharacterized protein n=1 Tax=Daphnia galeata TaxID=27404 RepID=A0A8J2RKT1_9CRUS|nr:unnamed protein product [Daphnia galeata]
MGLALQWTDSSLGDLQSAQDGYDYSSECGSNQKPLFQLVYSLMAYFVLTRLRLSMSFSHRRFLNYEWGSTHKPTVCRLLILLHRNIFSLLFIVRLSS